MGSGCRFLLRVVRDQIELGRGGRALLWRVFKAQERSLDLIPEEIESPDKLLRVGRDTGK